MIVNALGTETRTTVRTVKWCNVTQEGDIITLAVCADGFLYNMVRIIAGTALAVGYNRLKDDCYIEIFKTGNRALAGETLPPYALFLDKVYY